MTWGTCYKGSNNIHFNYPPIMNDGRNYSNYETGANLDNKLKKNANIETNSDYRKYLQTNADSIIKNNQLSACSETTTNPYFSGNIQNLSYTKPYIFNSILSKDQPFGYEDSDLKNIYLSKQVLEAQMHAPRFRIPNEVK
tara:strand:+ start:685 stop:1104 length:420 start_codon:yes stop_codon:yes gene_type:complete